MSGLALEINANIRYVLMVMVVFAQGRFNVLVNIVLKMFIVLVLVRTFKAQVYVLLDGKCAVNHWSASGPPEILYETFHSFNLSSLASKCFPAACAWHAACFARQTLHLFHCIVPIDQSPSVCAWGKRQESWGNIILELFSKMTALAPS